MLVGGLNGMENLMNVEEQSPLFGAEKKPNESIFLSLTKKEKPSKIGFKEGTGIIMKGFGDVIMGIIKAVKNNPVKTVASMGLAMTALSVLPALGISMTAGGASLAFGFACLALFVAAKNIYFAKRKASNGNDEELRRSLYSSRKCIADIAMRLPFVPKALKHMDKYTPLCYQSDELVPNNVKKIVKEKIKNEHLESSLKMEEQKGKPYGKVLYSQG